MKMCQHAVGTKATLRSERDSFEEAMECLKDDLSQAQIAHNEAEAQEQEVIANCQCMLKVFKIKKYKEQYEDGKCGSSLKYSLWVVSEVLA